MIQEKEVDILLSKIVPTVESNKKRSEIFEYVSRIITQNSPECRVCCVGSFALRAYLPEGDIDLILFRPERKFLANNSVTGISSGRNSADVNKQALFDIFSGLFAAVESASDPIQRTLNIRNVEFINARTSVVSCTINNCKVDIAVNQVGSVATTTFLEESARIVGMNNLFKRSLILIKCWCLHESQRYCGHAICGSKQGMLSSYALSVLILFILNKFPHCTTPFSVMWTFFNFYAQFDWGTYALSVSGLVPLTSFHNGSYLAAVNEASSQNNPSARPKSNSFSGSAALGANQATSTPVGTGLDKLIQRLRQCLVPSSSAVSLVPSSSSSSSSSSLPGGYNKSFLVKSCNIIDPVNATNNLGISVARYNLQAICAALGKGRRHLDTLCSKQSKLPFGKQLPPLPASTSLFPALAPATSVGGQGKAPDKTVTASADVGSTSSSGSGSGDESNVTRISPNAAAAAAAAASAYSQSSWAPNGDDGSAGNAVSGAWATDRDSWSGEPIASNVSPEGLWFLGQFFPISLKQYFSEDQIRADLRDHPMQLGTSTTYIPSQPGQGSSDLNGDKHPVKGAKRKSSGVFSLEENVFDVEVEPLWGAIEDYSSNKIGPSVLDVARIDDVGCDGGASTSQPNSSRSASDSELVVDEAIIVADVNEITVSSSIAEIVTALESSGQIAIDVEAKENSNDDVGNIVDPIPVIQEEKCKVIEESTQTEDEMPLQTISFSELVSVPTEIEATPLPAVTNEIIPQLEAPVSTVSLSTRSPTRVKHGQPTENSPPLLTESETDTDEELRLNISTSSGLPKYGTIPSSSVATFYSSVTSNSSGSSFSLLSNGVNGGAMSAVNDSHDTGSRQTSLPPTISRNNDMSRSTKNKRIRSKPTQTRNRNVSETQDEHLHIASSSAATVTSTNRIAPSNVHTTTNVGSVSAWKIWCKEFIQMLLDWSGEAITKATTPKWWGLQNVISKGACKFIVWSVVIVSGIVCYMYIAQSLELMQGQVIVEKQSDISSGTYRMLSSRRPRGTYNYYLRRRLPVEPLPLARTTVSCSARNCAEGNCEAAGDLRCRRIGVRVDINDGDGDDNPLEGASDRITLPTGPKSRSPIPIVGDTADIEINESAIEKPSEPTHMTTSNINNDSFGIVPDDEDDDSDADEFLYPSSSAFGKYHKERFIHWVSEGSNLTLGITEGLESSDGHCDDAPGSLLSFVSSTSVLSSPSERIGASNLPSTLDQVAATANRPMPLLNTWIYTWYRDNTLLTSTDGNNDILALRSIRREDSGVYKCIKSWIDDRGRSCEQRIIETIIFVSVPPYSTTKSRYLQVERGSQIYFQLSAHGSPAPSFQWMRNGIVLPDQTRSALVINAVNSSHIGTYTCLMTNVAGSFEWLEASVFCL